MKALSFVFLALTGLSLVACQGGQAGESTDAASKDHHAAGHWDYEGQESPEHWGELSPEYVKCAEGHFQSPIDIESYASKEHPGHILDFRYHPSPFDVENNGHTIQANLEEDNILEAQGHTYALKQFHFHEPSEHHLDGVIFPMEMHLVHADSSGKLAVVGLFIKEGEENPYLRDLWSSLPQHPQEHVHPNGRFDLQHLLPEEKAVFHYSGSLTTPPCTEGVEWYVMKEPVTMSKSQMNEFRRLYHDNNRPVQQQEARSVEFAHD